MRVCAVGGAIAPSTTGRDPTVSNTLVGVRGHRLMADNSGLRAALERANEATAEFSADPPDPWPWPPFLGLTKPSALQKYPLRQKPFSSGTEFVPAFRRIWEPMPVPNARHGARSNPGGRTHCTARSSLNRIPDVVPAKMSCGVFPRTGLDLVFFIGGRFWSGGWERRTASSSGGSWWT